MTSGLDRFERLLRLVELGDRRAADELAAIARRRNDALARVLALASGEPSPGAWHELVALVDETPEAQRAALVARLTRLVAAWPIERVADPRWVLECLDLRPAPRLALANAIELRGIPITDGAARALAVAPELRHIRRLTLRDADLSGHALTRILDSPDLHRPTHLDLGGNYVRWQGAEAIASCPRLDALTHLELVYNYIGPEGAEALAASRHLTALRHLGLASNAIGTRGARALARGLRGLERLDLSANTLYARGVEHLLDTALADSLVDLDLGGNKLGDDGPRAIAATRRLERLERLDLHFNNIGEVGCRALARAHLPALQTLELRHNAVDARGAGLLASSSLLERVTRLDLGKNPIADRGLRALARTPALARLQRLTLDHAGLGPDAALSLSDARWPQLECLVLAGNRLGHEAGAVLAHAAWLDDLVELDLSGCRIGEGLSRLWAARRAHRLETLGLADNALAEHALALTRVAELRPVRLDLARNHLESDLVEALADSDLLTATVELSLDGNTPGVAGARALARAPRLASLERLRLGDAGLRPEIVTALMRGNQMARLQRLELGNNLALGEAGVRALVRTIALPALESLSLDGCGLTDKAAIALSTCRALARLRHLDLSNNAIGDHGASALARSGVLSGLESLDLHRNRIGDDGALALAERHLLALDLKGNPIAARGAAALRGAPALRHCRLVL